MKKLILFFTLYMLSNSEAVAQNACYTKDGYIAATSEKYLDNAIRYSVDKDAVALQKLMDAGVVVSMKPGIKVFVVDTHVFGGKLEFRVAGHTEVFWTMLEAIKCK